MSDVALTLLLQSGLLPFAAALVLLVATRRWLGNLAPAAALLAGFLAAFFVIHRWSAAPQQAIDWLPYLAIAGVAIAATAQRRQWQRAAWLGARIGLILAAIGLLAQPVLAQWATQKIALLFLVAGGAWLALWLAFETNAGQFAGSLALLVATAGLAGVMALDSSLLLGQLGGAAASALFGCIALNFTRQKQTLARSGIALIVLLCGSLALTAYIYAALPATRLLWLALACAAIPAAARIQRMRSDGKEGGVALAAGAVAALPVAAALWQAWQAVQESGGY